MPRGVRATRSALKVAHLDNPLPSVEEAPEVKEVEPKALEEGTRAMKLEDAAIVEFKVLENPPAAEEEPREAIACEDGTCRCAEDVSQQAEVTQQVTPEVVVSVAEELETLRYLLRRATEAGHEAESERVLLLSKLNAAESEISSLKTSVAEADNEVQKLKVALDDARSGRDSWQAAALERTSSLVLAHEANAALTQREADALLKSNPCVLSVDDPIPRRAVFVLHPRAGDISEFFTECSGKSEVRHRKFDERLWMFHGGDAEGILGFFNKKGYQA